MKKILPLIIVLLTFTTLYGCKKEAENKSITLDKTTLSLKVGEEYSFKVSITPPEIGAPSWQTSDKDVVSINNIGKIKALSIGQATITVYSHDNTLQATCKVTVESTNATGISLNDESLSLFVDEEYALEYRFTPENTTNKEVTWSSSNPDVASVSNKGVVKALKIGETTITIFNHDKTLESSCIIKVEPTKATEISLNVESINLLVDEEYALKYEFTPENTTNKEVIWSSSNPDVATVDNKGTIKALKIGETTITIFNHDKTLESNCIVNVVTSKSLIIASYNVRNARGMDDIVNFDRVSSVINNMNAHAVAIQEVDSVTRRSNRLAVADELARRTNMFASFSASIEYQDGKYGNAILTKEKPLQTKIIKLPGSEEKRSLLIVELQDFILCCTHFSLTKSDRQLSVDIIQEATKEYNSKPVFLAGDLNADPTSTEIINLSKNWIMLSDPNDPTFRADNPTKTIDYIFYKQNSHFEHKVIARDVVNEPMASDHRPLWVEVEINTK